MRRSLTTLLSLGILLAAAASARADAPHEKLIASRADAFVSLKIVLSVQVSMGGQSNEFEQTLSARGVIVDPVGLIMLPSASIAPTTNRPGLELVTTPTSIRVIFAGDPKEYDAVLGATDSRLGLSFVRIKDLEGKELKAIDMERTVEPKIGDRLYGVARLGQGFDFAPYCDEASVIAYVTKPRKMWVVQGGFTQTAHPLFTANDELAGFLIDQEGVGGEGEVPGLLPLKVVLATIERAGKAAQEVLDETLAREAEGGGEGEKPAPGDVGPGDGEEGGSGDGAGAGEGDDAPGEAPSDG